MGSMQLFRAVMMALANSNTLSGDGGVVMTRSSSLSTLLPDAPKLKTWRKAGQKVIFVDPSGWLNLAASVSASAILQTRDCAARTIDTLAKFPGPDGFDAVFLAQFPLHSYFDAWYRIEVADEEDGDNNAFAQDHPPWSRNERRCLDIATKALGDRSTLVRVIQRASRRWIAMDRMRKTKCRCLAPDDPCVTLAIRLDAHESLRGIDIGPSADRGEDAVAFRAFWGEKSELRRFQDGSIKEAVVWDRTPGERHLVVDDLLKHALSKHLTSVVSVSCAAGVLDRALYRQASGPRSLDEDIHTVRSIEDAVTRLGKKLRSLDGLILTIVGTQALAPVLRHAAVFPPRPHRLAGSLSGGVHATEGELIPRCPPAIELLCQLEGSGKWPNEPEAFNKMKAAVGTQLAQSLQTNLGIYAMATEDYVDIMSEGFVFRLRLYTDRDSIIQRKVLKDAGLDRPYPEDDIELRIWHQGLVAAAAAKNPAFEPTVRLAKRWVAAQWLSPHIREEAVELIVVSIFADENVLLAAPPPSSRLNGFLRFLLVLGQHPWSAKPLFPQWKDSRALSPSCDHTREDAMKSFMSERRKGTAPAMFLMGPDGKSCVGWTRDRPAKPLLHRASILAQKAARELGEYLSGGLIPKRGTDSNLKQDAIFKDLFCHNLEGYELLIKLRTDALSNADFRFPYQWISTVFPSSSAGHERRRSRLGRSDNKRSSCGIEWYSR